MTIYIAVFAVLFFVAIIFDILPFRLSPKLEFAIFSFLTVYLMLFAALRTTGLEADYSRYREMFYEISSIKSLSRYSGYSIEYGYMLFNRLFMGSSYYTFTAALVLVTVLPKVIYIYTRCSRKFIGLAYYFALVFIQNDMGLLRQSIASGILYYAMDALSEGKRLKFTAIVLLACTFHSSAVLMFLLLLTGTKHYSLRRCLCYTALCLAGAFILYMYDAVQYFDLLNSFMSEQITFVGKVEHYLNNINQGDIGLQAVLSELRRILLLIVFAHLLKITQQHQCTEAYRKRIRVYYNTFLLSVLIPSLFMHLGGLVSHRGVTIFRPTEIFLFSELFTGIRAKTLSADRSIAERLLLMILMGYLCVHNIVNVLTGYEGYIPYTWEL